MSKRQDNQRLMALIRNVENTIGPSSSKEELLAAVEQVRHFKGPLSFDNTWLMLFGVLSTLGTLVVLSVRYWDESATKRLVCDMLGGSWRCDGNLVGTLPIFGMMICFGYLAWRKRLLSRVSKRIARYSSWINSDLRQIETSGPVLLQMLSNRFRDYHRGNYSREITSAFSGVYNGAVHPLAYAYYQLHYVDRRVVSKGKSGGTETVYLHYDRYSLVIDFPWVEGITVRAADGISLNLFERLIGRGARLDLYKLLRIATNPLELLVRVVTGADPVDLAVRFRPASTAFNNAFVLSGEDSMACARFAKPATVLHLLAMHKHLHGLTLEFGNGQLCLSFDDKNLLDVDIPCDLGETERFFALIDQGVGMPRLQRALDMVHILAEQHDENFELPLLRSAGNGTETDCSMTQAERQQHAPSLSE